MISTYPKFRSDLTVSQQENAAGRFFVVKDPLCGEFFRFGEAEEFITRQLDGETPLEAVRKNAEEELGATIPAETLDAFIKNLEKTGLLETDAPRTKKVFGRQGRISGSSLYLRVKLFDPDRLLNRLVGRVWFFFTPHFLALSCALILLAAGIATENWGAFRQDLSRLYRFSAVPVVLAIMYLVVSLHEFAHGLTCKHFGGEVHEMGFILIYFQPALYCNVSDAWLFPEKSKRLWVGFAGAYFELFLWALATLVWRITDRDAWINYLALIVMAGSGVKTLLNFNPFLKLDGYYLLSDYLEIPNLRRKAYRYAGSMLKRLVGYKDTVVEEVTGKGRIPYLVYGLVAMVSSVSLLGYVGAIAGGYLVEGRRPMAILLPLCLVGLKFRRRFRRLFGNSQASDSFDDFDDFDSASTRASEPVRSAPVQMAVASAEPARVESVKPQPPKPQPANPPAALQPSTQKPMRSARGWDVATAIFAICSENSPLSRKVRSAPVQMAVASAEPARVESVKPQPPKPQPANPPAALQPSTQKPKESSLPRNKPQPPETKPAAPRASIEPSKQSRKPPPISKRWITWAAVAGVVLVVLFFGKAELRVPGPVNILPRENADVRAKVEGIIDEIHVDEGDEVKEGQLIARLSDRDERAELQKVEADLEAKRARLQLLLVGPRREEIELARKALETSNTRQQQAVDLYVQAKRTRDERLSLTEATIKKNEERLQFAEKNLKMYQTLVEEGLGARKLLDEAAEPVAVRTRELQEARAERQVLVAEDLAEIRKEVAITEKEAKEAQGRLQILLAGTRREDIQALQAEIRRSEAERAYLQEQIDGTQVISPATGIIATPSQQLKAMNRQLVKKGDLIAKVYDFKTVTAQIIISEKEIAGVRVGHKVVLRARAYPSETFNGVVTSIATAAQSASGGATSLAGMTPGTSTSTDKMIVVTTQIENPGLLLKAEMTGQAKIFCGPRRIWELGTRRVARTFNVEFWSWW